MEFKDLLSKIAGRFPSKKAFAEALDIDPSRLTRAINAGDFPFNIENCLRLAKLSGESPTEILRSAGKVDIAELIESLYGREAEYTAKERELIETWRSLTPQARGALEIVFNDLAQAAPIVRKADKPKRRAS